MSLELRMLFCGKRTCLAHTKALGLYPQHQEERGERKIFLNSFCLWDNFPWEAARAGEEFRDGEILHSDSQFPHATNRHQWASTVGVLSRVRSAFGLGPKDMKVPHGRAHLYIKGKSSLPPWRTHTAHVAGSQHNLLTRVYFAFYQRSSGGTGDTSLYWLREKHRAYTI